MTKGQTRAIELLLEQMEATRQMLTDIGAVNVVQEAMYSVQELIEDQDELTGDDGQFGMGA